MNVIQVMLHSKGLAQQIAPYETGNLSQNAITSKVTPKGFRIEYSDRIAPYLPFLEEGTKYSQEHKDFIKKKTVYAITRYVDDVFNQKQTNETVNWKALAEKSKDNPARQQRYLQSMAR